MYFRIFRVAAIICVIFLSSVIYAANHAEYLALREKTPIATLSSVEDVTAQFPALAGKFVEVEGEVTGVFCGDKGYGYMLSQTHSKPLLLFSQESDSNIAVGATLHVLARIPAKGIVLDSIVTTTGDPEVPFLITDSYEDQTDEEGLSQEEYSVTRFYRAPDFTPQPAERKPPVVDLSTQNWQQSMVEVYAERIREINGSLDAGTAKTIASCLLKESTDHNVDPRLIFAIITQESRFNPKAVSRSGAMGLGQLMPRTAAGLGVSNAFDIAENMCGTVRYISYQLNRFGHISLALAAYNAGPGAVNKYGGVPPYNETINYVSRIWNNYAHLAGIDPQTGQ